MVADDGEFRVGTDERLAFLPSPVTWLEWRIPKSEAKARVGVLLEQKAHTPDAATVFFGFDSGSIAVVAMLVLPLAGSGHHGKILAPKGGYDPTVTGAGAAACVVRTYANLAIVNSPRIVGRREHAPHRGLEKRLRDAAGKTRHVPLQDWVEVVLDIAPSGEFGERGDGAGEGRLTGSKALHFCRQHL